MSSLNILITTFALTFTISSLRAATTSNFDYLDTTWAGDTVTKTAYLASSFTTGSTSSSYSLDSVLLGMGVAIEQEGGFTVTIRSNNSSRPGTVLGVLVGEDNPSEGTFTYTPQTTILLDSNTTYWVVAGVSGGDGEFRWLASNSNNQTGDWTIGNNIGFSTNAGSSWSIMNYPPSLLAVNATAVPEAGGTFFVALGAAAVFSRRRRAA